jgi:hypothetical protein
MSSMEPGSKDELYKKKRAGPLATEHKPPNEQKQAEGREQTPQKPAGPAWRRALVPSLYIAGTGVFLYAAWRWLRPKNASKRSRSTWTLDNTLGPYE